MQTLTVGNVAQIDDIQILSAISMTCWRCAQSDTNPSPCYLANIRVIFEKNSEQAGRNVKNACVTSISRISGYFNIREEQGALFGRSPTGHLVNCEAVGPLKW